MRRAALLLGLLVATIAPPASAQQTGTVYRLGILGGGDANRAGINALRLALGKLGDAEGKNLEIRHLYANGDYKRLPALAAQLLKTNPDVIVVNSNPAAVAMHHATSTVPIVMAVVGDPVGAGLVASLARPGGNITGVTTNLVELVGKQLELLKQVVPGLRRVAIVLNPSNDSNVRRSLLTERAASALGLQSFDVDVSAANQIVAAFGNIASRSAGGIILLPDSFMNDHAAEIVRLAAAHRLPATYPLSAFVDAGGLMLYAPSTTGLWTRAAYYVDHIFKGAKPADLPVEEPNSYEFILNVKTAAALGLKISPLTLSIADHVIK